MMTAGVDAHKETHTVVVVDGNGKQTDQMTVNATDAGHRKLVRWANERHVTRWAVEDCRPVTRRLERELLGAGHTVVRVPPKLMAQARTSARQAGKSDPIDALSVARAALRHDDLPIARLDGPERLIRLVSDRRGVLVAERTRLVNAFRWKLHELDPSINVGTGWFNTNRNTQTLIRHCRQWAQSPDPVTAQLAIIGQDELDRIVELNDQIKTLTTQLGQLITNQYPNLISIVGINVVNAAVLIGHVGNIDRFRNENAFASLVGTAPIPISSGNKQRVRLNRGGNRTLNAVIYRIAITQLAHHQPAQQLVTNITTRGKTKKEAIRILKRHITRTIYKQLAKDQTTTPISIAA